MLDIRITEIENELNLIDRTLSSLPNTEHAEVLSERLCNRIDIIQNELEFLYEKYDPIRYKLWKKHASQS